MKPVDIINLTAYTRLSKLPSLSKLHWLDQAKWCIIPPSKVGTMIAGDIYVSDWLRRGLCQSSKDTCLLLLIFSFFFLPREHDVAVFSRDAHRANLGVAVSAILKITQWGWKAVALSLPILLSLLFFLSPCYSSMLNTSASAFACVAWIYMNVSLAGDNGGQVIDMCRRTQDKQPTPTGVTPACLIHFDWAKTEGWSGGGRAREFRLKRKDKMTEREFSRLPQNGPM